MRSTRILLLCSMLLLLLCLPVSAASFGPNTITISIEDGFWQKYHLANPASVSGDVEKIYKVKKVEVRLLAGEREFGSHTFTPEDSAPRKFSLLHGVASALSIRIKSSAVEDVIWISTHPYKYTGTDIVIKAAPTGITLNYPGI